MALIPFFCLVVALTGLISPVGAMPSWFPSSRTRSDHLRIENFLNEGIGFNVVSSLIVGSKSAILVDVPIDVPHAKVLADWVRKTTDQPLVAVFTTHHHHDHNLGVRVILDEFKNAQFFASENVKKHIVEEYPIMSERMRTSFGRENITSDPALPSVFPNSFFTLKNHEDEPVHIIKNMVGDTVDANMFWLPSQKLLIAGDAVYHREMHLWLADMNTAALSDTWLKTLEFIKSLKPSRVIPGHAASLDFNSALDVEHCAKYVRFFQANIARRGPSYFTPDQITQMLVHAFPNRLDGPGGWSSGMFVNQTAGKFGRDSGRAPDILDMNQFNNVTYLQNWDL